MPAKHIHRPHPLPCRYERLGQDGPHSLFRWYRAFEASHFPDPAGLRSSLEYYSFGLYPGVIKAAMWVFDVPEAIAVVRTEVCAAGGNTLVLSRVNVLAYYAGESASCSPPSLMLNMYCICQAS